MSADSVPHACALARKNCRELLAIHLKSEHIDYETLKNIERIGNTLFTASVREQTRRLRDEPDAGRERTGPHVRPTEKVG